MATRFEIWKQAVKSLEFVATELDQAHAMLKDIDQDHIDIGRYGHHPTTIKDLVTDAGCLLKELRAAECPECDHLIWQHGDRYGCEYERGDISQSTRDGGTVLAAAGPCHCKWGLEEPGARHLPGQ